MMRPMAVMVWNSERIFHDGTAYFNALEEDLARVQKSVDLETYIFEDDGLGRKMAKTLGELAERGVRVRVMVDGVGSPGFYGRFGDELTRKGIQVRIFNPSPLDLSLFSYKFFPGLSRLLQFFWSANRRNHRKVFVLDEKVVWTGGINISAKQVANYEAQVAWRDTGIRVEGREVAEFLKAFEAAWSHGWTPVPQKKTLNFYWQRYRSRRSPRTHRLVQFNFTRSLRRRTHMELVRNIQLARERIWITTAYFIPEKRIMRALRYAAKRGIDVRIIVPCKSDVIFTQWVGAAHYFKLLKAGVKIFEYLPCMIHAKTFVIDDWGMVGSTNLNHRSIFHDLEVNVLVTTEEGIRSLTNQFLIDQAQSRLIDLDDWKSRPLLVRIAGNLLMYLKYWF
ncbi:MAG TPA: phosphatidylserine/phosphatidylglycerophosphate/cardiolipin synthase family protein [Bdellovibrionales bacterium]|nr:phosphatidylserine/phosphatidylglycerophosphate/cardiolipin synthase family protein [Bdellovibrionales bacterium]